MILLLLVFEVNLDQVIFLSFDLTHPVFKRKGWKEASTAPSIAPSLTIPESI
jgi:hypothetical protein